MHSRYFWFNISKAHSQILLLHLLLRETKEKHTALPSGRQYVSCLEMKTIVRISIDTLSCQWGTADFRWKGLQRGTLLCTQLNGRWGDLFEATVGCIVPLWFHLEGLCRGSGPSGKAPTTAYYYFCLSVAQQERENSCVGEASQTALTLPKHT